MNGGSDIYTFLFNFIQHTHMNLLDPIYRLNPAKQSKPSPQLNAYVCPNEEGGKETVLQNPFLRLYDSFVESEW